MRVYTLLIAFNCITHILVDIRFQKSTETFYKQRTCYGSTYNVQLHLLQRYVLAVSFLHNKHQLNNHLDSAVAKPKTKIELTVQTLPLLSCNPHCNLNFALLKFAQYCLIYLVQLLCVLELLLYTTDLQRILCSQRN